MNTYSKLVFEVKGPGERDINRYTIMTSSWDMDINSFFESCNQLALAAGYGPELVNEYWSQE